MGGLLENYNRRIDVIQGGDRAGQLCLRLRLQSKATNPTFGGRIWMLLQTTQTHYISGELNVLRKKYFEVDTLNEFPSLSADRTSGLCAWSRTETARATLDLNLNCKTFDFLIQLNKKSSWLVWNYLRWLILTTKEHLKKVIAIHGAQETRFN